MNALRIATGVAVSGITAMATTDHAQAHWPASMYTLASTAMGGKEGPSVCVHDNGLPLDDFGAPASQEDPVYPFFAEAADDFMFEGEGQCRITEIVFWVNFFNVPAGGLPDPSVWTAVRLAVYLDDGGDPKHPAGWPQSPYTGFRIGQVVYEVTIPITDVITTPLAMPTVPNVWEVRLETLAEEFVLQRGEKYWLALAPQVQFAIAGQTSWMLSEDGYDNPASQVFQIIGILPWESIGGDGLGHRDLAFSISGEFIDPGDCPWDLNNDQTVNAADLALVLGRWGEDPGAPPDFDENGIVDAADLAQLLGNWGPCVTP